MKCNGNKFAHLILFKLYPIVPHTGLLMSTGYPMKKGFPCNPFKNTEAVTESQSLKKNFS